jgi:hypothetical protein
LRERRFASFDFRRMHLYLATDAVENALATDGWLAR